MKLSPILLVVLYCLSAESFATELNQADNADSGDIGSGQSEDDHGEDDHAFEFLTAITARNVMDKTTFEALLQSFNETCLTSTDVFSRFNISDSGALSEDQFIEIAPYVALHLKEGFPCNASLTKTSFGDWIVNLFGSTTVCRRDFNLLIDEIVDNGKFTPNPSSEKCFGGGVLLETDCTSSAVELKSSLMKMIAAMIRGDCILPQPTYFMDELKEYLQATSGKIPIESIANLLKSLNIGGKTPLVIDESHDHDAEESKPTEVIVVGDRHKRSTDAKEDETKCYSTLDFVSIFGIDRNNFSLSDFSSICPAIIQQIVSGACQREKHDDLEEVTKVDTNYTTAMKYGYGTAAVLVISMLAFGGLLLFPQIGTSGYQMTMQFFIALGVGTLSGDALLHIIPEVVGLHKHGEGDEHDHEEESEDDKTYIWRILVVIAGIYAFYLFENALRLWNILRGTNVTFHVHDDDGHTHHHESGTNHGQSHTTTAITVPNSTCPNSCNNDDEIKTSETIKTAHPLKTPLTGDEEPKQVICCGITPIGIMVLVGDILHNFGDGIALGVAFSSSWVGGLGASIAIFCHELPHEFGDFAIYLKNGMSKWKALGFNFMAACFAFIGLYIGLSISENPEAREWMLSVIAGMFLYIALVDVMHEMIEERTKMPILQFFIQNIGMCLGWAILLLLALYEDRIKSALE